MFLVQAWFLNCRSSSPSISRTSTSTLFGISGSTSKSISETNKIISNPPTTTTALRQLYPPWNETRIRNGTLKVNNVHTLHYVIYYGDSSSSLVGLFLHGGPGAGCFPNHARFFDSSRYSKVVLLDQRGCGQSTPTACVDDNTLHDLVEDCEKLRRHLELDWWDVVLGGSWGTTISLAYSQTYPNSVRSLILRGIFLLRSQEVDWLFSKSGGAARLYPERFQAFCQAVNDEVEDDGDNNENNNLKALHGYYQRLWAATNETERWNAARSWMQWEFFNSVAYKIPLNTNTSDRNATMEAIHTWKLSLIHI